MYYLCVVWFDRWVLSELWVGVFIVDIVTDTDELLSVVGAGDERHGYPHSITLRNQPGVGGIRLEEKERWGDEKEKGRRRRGWEEGRNIKR